MKQLVVLLLLVSLVEALTGRGWLGATSKVDWVSGNVEERASAPSSGKGKDSSRTHAQAIAVQHVNDVMCLVAASALDEDSASTSTGFGSGFQPLQVLCEVNGFTVPAIIDTGAEITIMSASCAKRCRISSAIDTRFSGRAVGVGSSDILGRIDGLGMRIGPVSFDGRVAVLRESRVDFLIGLDFLRRFECEVSLKENIVKLTVRGKVYKVPLLDDGREANMLPRSSASATLSKPSSSSSSFSSASASTFADNISSSSMSGSSSGEEEEGDFDEEYGDTSASALKEARRRLSASASTERDEYGHSSYKGGSSYDDEDDYDRLHSETKGERVGAISLEGV